MTFILLCTSQQAIKGEKVTLQLNDFSHKCNSTQKRDKNSCYILRGYKYENR